jgi:2-polyprenyl-6-methoxyphenol hydroxylase-like FAD-dependent oxidoreductase
LSVTVLERRPQLEPESVGPVLQFNSLAVREQLGVFEQVCSGSAIGYRIATAKQCDPSGRVCAQASYRELRHPIPFSSLSSGSA